MIQLDGFDLRRIERNRIVHFGLFEQVLLLNKEKLGLWIDKAFNQPRTGDSIYFDVFSGNPSVPLENA